MFVYISYSSFYLFTYLIMFKTSEKTINKGIQWCLHEQLLVIYEQLLANYVRFLVYMWCIF